ncbi:MAG: BREX-6 system BrxE protein [Deltaproteobacteria bacterium]|nr:BREX-6 system BrxE protein [Deltaproteobacteria bacterium]
MADLFDQSTAKRQSGPTEEDVDALLTAQLAVAWAGEGGDEEPRLGWWKSDLVSEFGGEDLFRQMLPHTWRWATLQAAREAARRMDAGLRDKDHNPDQVFSLFRFGFDIDQRVDERLHDLKRSGVTPTAALPGLKKAMQATWDASTFVGWLKES